MKPVHDDSRFGRVTNFIGLAAALGFMTIAITQCRVVGNAVTGVDLKTVSSAHGKDDCVRDCNEAYKDAREAEQDRHKAAKRACGRDESCKRNEDCRHERILEDLKEQKKECKKGCYNEGSGSGGR